MLGTDPARKKLRPLLEKRSQEVLQRFREAATSELKNPELIEVIEEVKAYWKDLQRPALASFSSEAVGGEPSKADDAILAITLTAAGMGIHDDIIDKSENKHFRYTAFGRFGPDKSLLAGDILIIKGLTTAQKLLEETCPPEKRNAVLEAMKSFLFEIYQGELMSLSCNKNLDTDLLQFSRILWMLTADAEASARIGAILGGGSEVEIQTLAEFGRRLGFILILGEEIRDTMNEEGELQHRLQYESVPLPVLYAAQSSKETFCQIKSFLEKPLATRGVFEITELCWKSRAMNYVYGLAKQNAEEANNRLKSIRNSNAREVLSALIKTALYDVTKARTLERQYAKYSSS